jgi:myo-inositol 2-dehydrogenase/D-chiro-inositol 1-dehydrogenase
MASSAESTDPPERVRLAILGLGAVAQAVHLPLLDRLADRFSVGAIADLSPSLVAAIGDRYRVPERARFNGLEGLLTADGIDGLLVLTSGSHGSAVIAGLDRGLAVFAEKPLAWTLAEADAIAERLAADPSRKLQLGYMKLYDPAVVRGVAAARGTDEGSHQGSDGPTGGLGPVRSIEVTVLHPSDPRQLNLARLLPPPTDVPAATLDSIRSEADRLRTLAVGSSRDVARLYSDIVLGSIVHDLALIRAFASDPTGIDLVDTWPAGRWPPSVAIAGRLEGEARFAVRWHFLPDYAAYREEVRVVYDAATIELEFPSPYLLHAPTRLRITELEGNARRDRRYSSVGEAFEEELLAFHSLVTTGRQPLAGLDEGRADIVTSQGIAARYAAQLGLPINGEATSQKG